MIKNKFFNKSAVQKRLEDRLLRYYNAIDNQSVKDLLDQMPKNRETLDIIEDQLDLIVSGMDKKDTETNKWKKLMYSVETAALVAKYQQEKEAKEESDSSEAIVIDFDELEPVAIDVEVKE